MAAVEKRAQPSDSPSMMLVSIEFWDIAMLTLTNDLTRRILKPDCAIWRG